MYPVGPGVLTSPTSPTVPLSAERRGGTKGTTGQGAFRFFMITGFHGTHVLIGVVVLSLVAVRVRSGRTSGEGVELVGLYWHFVDLVWVFIFTCFYLI
jgi:cytochrome c oxidase subunit 3